MTATNRVFTCGWTLSDLTRRVEDGLMALREACGHQSDWGPLDFRMYDGLEAGKQMAEALERIPFSSEERDQLMRAVARLQGELRVAEFWSDARIESVCRRLCVACEERNSLVSWNAEEDAYWHHDGFGLCAASYIRSLFSHTKGTDFVEWDRDAAPAQILVHRLGEMHERGRKDIAKWLRDQAHAVESGGNYDDVYRARYLK